MDNGIKFLAVIIIIVFFILIVIGLWFAVKYSVKPQLYGTWSQPTSTNCINATYCSDVGEITTREICTPNPVTGWGCQNDSGQQTFAPRIVIQECHLACQASVWRIEQSDCIVDAEDNTSCIMGIQPPVFGSTEAITDTSSGTQTTTYTCVPHDPTGLNNCILIQPTQVVTTTGEVQTVYQTVVHEIGDIVTETNSCNTYSNPQCGQWTFYTGNTASTCSLQVQSLSNQETCITSDNTSIYDILKEGYYLNTMNCKLSSGLIVPTNPEDPVSELCASEALNQMGDSCTTDSINSMDIKEGLIPVGSTAVLCPSSQSNPTQNPLCYQPCRLVASPDVGFSVNNPFNFFLHNLIIIRKKIKQEWAFLTTMQAPNIDGNILGLRGPSTNPINALTEYDDTPLIFVTPKSVTQTPICSWEKTTFNSALITSFGIRSINANQGEAQILSGILRNYIGWLSTSQGNQMIWRQALSQYSGPGITSDDAPKFNVKINMGLTQVKLPNFSDDLLGVANINILYQGNIVNVPVLNGSSVNLNDIQLLVFNPNIISKLDTNLCNIFIKNI